MKLPNWTDQDADKTGDFRDEMTHERHLATEIVNLFEDWLDKLGIRVPNAERDEQMLDASESHFYGEQYDNLVESVQNVIDSKLSDLS